jgi:hypothetical protein
MSSTKTLQKYLISWSTREKKSLNILRRIGYRSLDDRVGWRAGWRRRRLPTWTGSEGRTKRDGLAATMSYETSFPNTKRPAPGQAPNYFTCHGAWLSCRH